MKYGKTIALVVAVLILTASAGCSNQESPIEEEPYIKYIVTTYSGGKVIDIFEVYSNMGWSFDKNSAKVYDNPNEKVLLFYSTLDYKLEEMPK